MTKPAFIFFLYILIASTHALAGTGNYKSGAAAAAMSNAALTRTDVWSLFHNPAAIAFLHAAEAGVAYERRFSLKELSLNGLALAVPAGKKGTAGINAAYFGYKNYNEQLAGLTYAMRFSNRMSAAVKLNYQAFTIGNEYGSHSTITGEAALLAEVVKDLWLAAHIYNPVQARLTETPSEKIPSLFAFAAGYIFSEKLKIEAGTEKSSDDKAFFRSGIEYQPVKGFWLRAGIATLPFSSSFGFGLDLSNIRVDFAAGFHPQLGFTPHVGLSYRFGPHEK